MQRPHVGKRGRVLLFFGCVDVIYALSLALPEPDLAAGSMFTWLVRLAPLWLWAAVWGAVGALCLFFAFRRRDYPGYAAATLLKVFWGVVCLGGWVVGDVQRGFASAAIWLGLAYLMFRVLAPWPEPNDSKGPTWIRPSA